MTTRTTLDLIAADGTPRMFTLSEIAAHYAHHCSLRRRDFLERHNEASRAQLLQQTNSATVDEDQAKMYDCDFHLMLNNYDECFEWATGPMGFHLSDEDQADYDAWRCDKNKLSGDDWQGYRALKAQRDAESKAFQDREREMRRAKLCKSGAHPVGLSREREGNQ